MPNMVKPVKHNAVMFYSLDILQHQSSVTFSKSLMIALSYGRLMMLGVLSLSVQALQEFSSFSRLCDVCSGVW